jgi:hypothetical protein
LPQVFIEALQHGVVGGRRTSGSGNALIGEDGQQVA